MQQGEGTLGRENRAKIRLYIAGNDVVLLSLLLTLNRFYLFFLCFHCSL